jgi:uncharacterized protein YaiI (UPF0178 family)
MTRIFVDADGCPVKPEVLRVAGRYGIKVSVVANTRMQLPTDENVERVIVGSGLDAADDWIAERASEGDIVISGDIPLASRCLERGARVIDFKGGELTPETIGDAMGSRELMAYLRESGVNTGGPAPFEKKDRSRFLSRLDEVIQSLRRGG